MWFANIMRIHNPGPVNFKNYNPDPAEALKITDSDRILNTGAGLGEALASVYR